MRSDRATLRQSIGLDMVQAIGADGEKLDDSWSVEIVDALWADLAAGGSVGPPNGGQGFLSTLNATLRRVAAANGDVSAWQAALSSLRRHILNGLSDAGQVRDAENLLQQARVLIAEIAAQAWRYQRFRAEQDARRLSEASEAMAAAADLSSLITLMAQELPRAGVKSCYLSLYADPEAPADWARFILGYNRDEQVALDRGGNRFPSRQLIPPALWPQGEARSLVALPLYFQEHALGFVLFEMAEWALAGSDTLRQQISSALEGALLREDLSRAWQQAEEANRLKSRFLATVSHELRTPLSLIVGTTEMLQRESAAEAVRFESYQKDLHRIRTSAQHLSRLIGDVLDLASSQVGELRLACEPLPVETLLRKVALLGETLALEKGLVWAAEIPNGLPQVWGDRTRLQQVILNLISNAVKFTDQGFISLWAETGKGQVMVAVSDTGIGIPLAEQDVIFDEFRQSERSSARGYGGMGLGLAVSKRLVELHGGCMGVISSGTDGTGSTFFFTLPILQRTEGAKPAADHRSGTVLLLTEQAASGVRLQEHLIHRGYEVETLTIAGKPDWLLAGADRTARRHRAGS